MMAEIIVVQNLQQYLYLAIFCYTRKLDQFQIGGHVNFTQIWRFQKEGNLFEAVNRESNF